MELCCGHKTKTNEKSKTGIPTKKRKTEIGGLKTQQQENKRAWPM
jgi:hypothetical protein